jgi:hypothetical protein
VTLCLLGLYNHFICGFIKQHKIPYITSSIFGTSSFSTIFLEIAKANLISFTIGFCFDFGFVLDSFFVDVFFFRVLDLGFCLCFITFTFFLTANQIPKDIENSSIKTFSELEAGLYALLLFFGQPVKLFFF